ncbi:MAG: carboxylesterase family protein [Bacteroidales bacterium]|nr:carboxylesterase family protein [Bacteroidales bacterium]
MNRFALITLLSIVWMGCSHEDATVIAMQERMKAMYGENKVLAAVEAGQPSVTVENGTFVGRCEDGIKSFKGIPYAKPPVGNLRWRDPQPVDSSKEIREAVYYGKSAIQSLADNIPASHYKRGEDCLTANVWTADDTTKQRPVMVWIHGGSYGWGGTSDPIYDGHRFVKDHPEVVLVTINYRLGLMGFIDLTQMEGGESYTSSGCLGLLDQIEALKWVQRNIHHFGGDPSNVTVFGESAGGGSISFLTIMPQAQGLFKRAIIESGSVALSSTKEDYAMFIDKVREVTGVKTLDELKQWSEEDLIRANEEINDFNCFPLRDGKYIPTNPIGAYAQGNGKQVDMLMGTNADEVRFWIGGMGLSVFKLAMSVWFDNIMMSLPDEQSEAVNTFIDQRDDDRIWNIVEFMTELMFRGPLMAMADEHADAGGNTYLYYWSYPSALPERGACHCVEIAYVLNNLDETQYTGGNANESLAKETQQMWVNFAATGNPSTPAHQFPNYNTKTRQCMHLGDTIKVENDLLSKQRQVVSPLVRSYISPLYYDLNFNVPTIWRLASYVMIPLLLVIGFTIWLVRKKRQDKEIN